MLGEAVFNSLPSSAPTLGAVMILLTWFYITGLMILVGAEISSEIEAATAEKNFLGLRYATHFLSL
jgi:membrane protein